MSESTPNVIPDDRARGRMPDFFVVGHPKSGTSAMYRMLRSHPQIFMPDLKETWFFVPELQSRFRKPGGPRPDTEQEYVQLFAPAQPGQRAGEATPTYLMSTEAAQRIAAAKPDAKIIAVLREPASFLRSLHLQYVQTHVEDVTDLRTAISLEAERRAGRHIPPRSPRPQTLQYSELVRYTEQLERFHAHFPPEQVMVLIYEDFRADNEGTMRRVLEFLDVDPEVPVSLAEVNPSVQVRSVKLHKMLREMSTGTASGSLPARAVRALTPQGLRRATVKRFRRSLLFAQPDAPDEELMGELRVRYRDEVVRVSEYLGRDLVSLWGYGDVG